MAYMAESIVARMHTLLTFDVLRMPTYQIEVNIHNSGKMFRLEMWELSHNGRSPLAIVLNLYAIREKDRVEVLHKAMLRAEAKATLRVVGRLE